ncbi:MAG: two-component system response regulator [Acidobacteria bacterium]|nr:MAG: two-component system response regulator [Acidobacteriota bacterium]
MMNDEREPVRLLIADDDAEIRDVLREFLCERYECHTVDSAEAALACLSRESFDLIISDITMGGLSGLELVPRALRLAPDAVIIMISGAQTIEHAIAAMRAGAFDFLTKPFDLSQVEAAIRRALRHRALLVTKRRYEQHLTELVAQRTTELRQALNSLADSYRSTLQALAAALETRDRETHGHSERVVSFTLRLGHEVDVADTDLCALEFGALLHDIGKIGIPDAILRKPAALNEGEWERMRQHPSLGAQILAGIEFLAGAARVVAQHHERWDGTGYPEGRAGAEIDLNARIFAVADAFDAITSDRVYRAGRSYEAAVRELRQEAGRQFDPEVVAAFLRIPPVEWDELRARAARARHKTVESRAAKATGTAATGRALFVVPMLLPV